jgi:hypothetical protein
MIGTLVLGLFYTSQQEAPAVFILAAFNLAVFILLPTSRLLLVVAAHTYTNTKFL